MQTTRHGTAGDQAGAPVDTRVTESERAALPSIDVEHRGASYTTADGKRLPLKIDKYVHVRAHGVVYWPQTTNSGLLLTTQKACSPTRRDTIKMARLICTAQRHQSAALRCV